MNFMALLRSGSLPPGAAGGVSTLFRHIRGVVWVLSSPSQGYWRRVHDAFHLPSNWWPPVYRAAFFFVHGGAGNAPAIEPAGLRSDIV
jgi:hypothetical protein